MASVRGACSFCNSDRPPVEDAVFRLACPACGAPRLPPDAIFPDEATRARAESALAQARRSVRFLRLLRKTVVAFTITSTLLYAIAIAAGEHLQFLPVFSTSLLWLSVVISRRRRPLVEARRARRSLDEAYALAGVRSMQGAALALEAHLRIAETPDANEAPDAEALAAAEEAAAGDSFADFDRRLAEAEKTQKRQS